MVFFIDSVRSDRCVHGTAGQERAVLGLIDFSAAAKRRYRPIFRYKNAFHMGEQKRMQPQKRAAAAARSKLMLSMFLFGTISLFVRFVPLPSGRLSLARGVIGVAFLLALAAITHQPLSFRAIRQRLIPLCLSGICIGANWILLFEAYRYTTVAIATLCYYLAPIFVILVSPLLLKERLTIRKGVCAAVALLGMTIVSGIWGGAGGVSPSGWRGILFGVGAAACYASVQLLNRRLAALSAYEKTISQLAVASLVLVPYTLLLEPAGSASLSLFSVSMLLVLGVVHTGCTYALYFDSIRDLPAQTVAILSYIDPIVAILLSALVLGEPLGVHGAVGAALVLGATFLSELPSKKCA